MSQETSRSNLLGRWRKQHRNLGTFTMMLSVVAITALAASLLPNPLNSPDPFGVLSTFGTKGGVDPSNAFFQNLGTHGRTCGSCHVSSTPWTAPTALAPTFPHWRSARNHIAFCSTKA